MNNLELAREIMESMERLVSTIPLKLAAFDRDVCDMDTSKHCAHAHNAEDDKFYGRICINTSWLRPASLLGLKGIVAHEVAHFIHDEHGKKHEWNGDFLRLDAH